MMVEPSMIWPNHAVHAPLSVTRPKVGTMSQFLVALASWSTDWSKPERPRPPVRGAPLRRRPGNARDAEHDPGDAQELPRPDPLVQHARGEHEQEHDTERDDRLHES